MKHGPGSDKVAPVYPKARQYKGACADIDDLNNTVCSLPVVSLDTVVLSGCVNVTGVFLQRCFTRQQFVMRSDDNTPGLYCPVGLRQRLQTLDINRKQEHYPLRHLDLSGCWQITDQSLM